MLSLPVDRGKLEAFCQRWKIRELAVFGSALTPSFNPRSDVDVLVTFEHDAKWSLFDEVTMEDGLSALFARRVDLVSRQAIATSPNWIRRKAILDSAETIHVSR